MRVAGFDRLRTRGSVRAVQWFTPAGSGPDTSGAPMKKIVSAGIGLLALTGAAAAADLPAKAPVYKAPPVIVDPWSWTGVYIGLNAGYSWGRSDTDVDYFTSNAAFPSLRRPVPSPMPSSISTARSAAARSAPTGRAEFGSSAPRPISSGRARRAARLQLAPWPGGGVAGPCFPGLTFTPPGLTAATFAFDQKLQWFGTLRARLGVTLAPTVLAYVTGGLAYGEIETDGTLTGVTAAVAVVKHRVQPQHHEDRLDRRRRHRRAPQRQLDRQDRIPLHGSRHGLGHCRSVTVRRDRRQLVVPTSPTTSCASASTTSSGITRSSRSTDIPTKVTTCSAAPLGRRCAFWTAGSSRSCAPVRPTRAARATPAPASARSGRAAW